MVGYPWLFGFGLSLCGTGVVVVLAGGWLWYRASEKSMWTRSRVGEFLVVMGTVAVVCGSLFALIGLTTKNV